MKCVVTGGAGFIGSHLARTLLRKGMRVTVVDNFSTGKKENLKDVLGEIELLEGDIRDGDFLSKAFAGSVCVFHQAALPSVRRSIEFPLESNDVNVNGTLQVLWASLRAGVQRVVYAASSSVYGNTLVLPKHEGLPPNPMSPYALTKYAGEMYCKLFSELYRLETVCLRYFNVFGPNQDPHSPYAAVIPLFVAGMMRGQSPVINGDGTQTRDFCYIDNVVEANLLAYACKQANGQIVNIGCGERISLLELVDLINGLLGTRLDPLFAPPRPGDVKDSLASIELAATVLGYRPRVNVAEGLSRLIRWMRP